MCYVGTPCRCAQPIQYNHLKDRTPLPGALIKPLLSVPSQKGQHSPGIFTGFWQLCLHAIAVQCGSPSTHWQKVQSSSFHCSSWARSLLFTQQLAFVLSIDSSSTSETRWGTMRDEKGGEGVHSLWSQNWANLNGISFWSHNASYTQHFEKPDSWKLESTKGGV